MRVALIGQAAFGEAVYRRLLEQGEDIVGVFYEREGDPLHNLAVEQGVPTHPTQSLRRRDFMQTYADLGAELNVLAFVTVIIPERVLDLPPHGSIQYHPSLLPLHRGRSAINWAIINGETETGVTIFWVDRGIDTGPVLLQKTAPISQTDTLASLYRNHLFPQGVDGLAEAVAHGTRRHGRRGRLRTRPLPPTSRRARAGWPRSSGSGRRSRSTTTFAAASRSRARQPPYERRLSASRTWSLARAKARPCTARCYRSTNQACESRSTAVRCLCAVCAARARGRRRPRRSPRRLGWRLARVWACSPSPDGPNRRPRASPPARSW